MPLCFDRTSFALHPAWGNFGQNLKNTMELQVVSLLRDLLPTSWYAQKGAPKRAAHRARMPLKSRVAVEVAMSGRGAALAARLRRERKASEKAGERRYVYRRRYTTQELIICTYMFHIITIYYVS